jgi:hypothetical protein
MSAFSCCQESVRRTYQSSRNHKDDQRISPPGRQGDRSFAFTRHSRAIFHRRRAELPWETTEERRRVKPSGTRLARESREWTRILKKKDRPQFSQIHTTFFRDYTRARPAGCGCPCIRVHSRNSRVISPKECSPLRRNIHLMRVHYL